MNPGNYESDNKKVGKKIEDILKYLNVFIITQIKLSEKSVFFENLVI